MLSPDELWAARITKRILLDEHPWQRDATMDPARRISFCVGRGGAKTTTKRARALIKLIWLRGQRIGYAATSKEHARELNWDKLKDACENYDIRFTGNDPDVSFHDTRMVLTCHRTGSTYRLRGVEDRKDAEKFRGFPQAEMQVDECGSFPPELLGYLVDQCVAPRLGEGHALAPGLLDYLLHEWDETEDIPERFLGEHRGGCLVLGSTPPARLHGEFYEVTREGSKRHRPYSKRAEPEYEGWLGYSSHAWTLAEVVELPNARNLYPALVANWNEALREKAEKQWSDDNPIWKREYLGIWAADNTDTMFKYRPHVDGKAWNQWDPIGRPVSDVEGLKQVVAILRERFGDVRYVVAADEGYKDPFACNVYAFSPKDPNREKFHAFGFERTEMYARPIAELLLGTKEVQALLATGKFPEKFGGVFGAIGGWPDGCVLDGSETLIAELANTYGVRFLKADRKPDSKVGGVELVNGELVDGRWKIMKGTPLEQQIVVLQWKEDDFGIKREDKAQSNHSTDTLIYGGLLISSMFESGAVVQDAKPGESGIYQDPMGLDPEISPSEASDDSDSLAEMVWSDDNDSWD